MNLYQIVMLITTGGFASTVLIVDAGLKKYNISEEVRGFAGKTIIIIGLFLLLLLYVTFTIKS